MTKKDFTILFSVFALTGSGIYTMVRKSNSTPVATTHEAQTRAEKEFKRLNHYSKVQILKIEQLDSLNPLGAGWLVYHSDPIHKNKPLFISTDGSMEYVNSEDILKTDREISSN